MMYIHRTITAYFRTDTLNWQVLLGKKKYLLDSLCEKLNNIFLKQMQTVKNVSLPNTNK